MIRHVVALTFKSETQEESIARITDSLRTLPPIIKEIRSYTLGRDLNLAADTADFAIVADFDTLEDFEVYANHPAHLEVIREVIKPHVANRTASQFEFDPER